MALLFPIFRALLIVTEPSLPAPDGSSGSLLFGPGGDRGAGSCLSLPCSLVLAVSGDVGGLTASYDFLLEAGASNTDDCGVDSSDWPNESREGIMLPPLCAASLSASVPVMARQENGQFISVSRQPTH
jgi:hypothetical protein